MKSLGTYRSLLNRPVVVEESGFSPTSISGLRLWIDFSDTSTTFQDTSATTPATANDAPIGRINDKSGNGNNFTQATGGKRPLLKTAAQNGLSVSDYDNDNLSTTADLTGLSAATLFIVIKIDLDPPLVDGQSGLWTFGSDSASTHFPYTDGTIYDSFGTTSRKSTANPATTLAQWNIYEVVSASGEWTSYINSVQLYTTASNTVGFAASPNITIGSTASESAYLAGMIGELVLYDSALDLTNRGLLETYLQTKWGTP